MEPRYGIVYTSLAFAHTVHKAHYEKKTREAKKASQLAEKERQRKERETVQVGPLIR